MTSTGRVIGGKRAVASASPGSGAWVPSPKTPKARVEPRPRDLREHEVRDPEHGWRDARHAPNPEHMKPEKMERLTAGQLFKRVQKHVSHEISQIPFFRFKADSVVRVAGRWGGYGGVSTVYGRDVDGNVTNSHVAVKSRKRKY